MGRDGSRGPPLESVPPVVCALGSPRLPEGCHGRVEGCLCPTGYASFELPSSFGTVRPAFEMVLPAVLVPVRVPGAALGWYGCAMVLAWCIPLCRALGEVIGSPEHWRGRRGDGCCDAPLGSPGLSQPPLAL